MTFPVALFHISIERPSADVYAYVSNPQNMTQWAAGLSKSELRPDGDRWVADSPMGEVKIKFAAANDYGVVDHEVTLLDGTTVQNPLRIQANGAGSEVIFTVYRQPETTDADFINDQNSVRADLEKLKSILERR